MVNLRLFFLYGLCCFSPIFLVIPASLEAGGKLSCLNSKQLEASSAVQALPQELVESSLLEKIQPFVFQIASHLDWKMLQLEVITFDEELWGELKQQLETDTTGTLAVKLAYLGALKGHLVVLQKLKEWGYSIVPQEGFLPVPEWIPEFFAQPVYEPLPSFRYVAPPRAYAASQSPFSLKVAVSRPTFFWSRLNPFVAAVLKGHFEVVDFLIANYSISELLAHADGKWLSPQWESQKDCVVNKSPVLSLSKDDKSLFASSEEQQENVKNLLHFLLSFQGQNQRADVLEKKWNHEKPRSSSRSSSESSSHSDVGSDSEAPTVLLSTSIEESHERIDQRKSSTLRSVSFSVPAESEELDLGMIEQCHDACEQGNKDVIFSEVCLKLFHRGAGKAPQKDQEGFSFLHRLAYAGRLEILQELEAGELIKKEGLLQLVGRKQSAQEREAIQRFESLYVDQTPLQIALQRGHKETARFFLDCSNKWIRKGNSLLELEPKMPSAQLLDEKVLFSSEQKGLNFLAGYGQEDPAIFFKNQLRNSHLVEAMKRGYWQMARELVQLLDVEELYRPNEQGNHFLHQYMLEARYPLSVLDVQYELQVVLDPTYLLSQNQNGENVYDLYRKRNPRPVIEDAS